VYSTLVIPVELNVEVLNDVEVAIEVVEVIVVVETVVVEVNDVEMDVEIADATITMLVKPISSAVGARQTPEVNIRQLVTVTVYVPKSAGAKPVGTVNDPTIPPLPGPVIEQVPRIGVVGVFTEIVQKASMSLKPEPLTLTKNPGPADVGEIETVGGVAPETGGCAFNSAKATTDSNASVSTSDSFLRLLVNSRILQSYVTLSERVT
jgi:hypothetical protein